MTVHADKKGGVGLSGAAGAWGVVRTRLGHVRAAMRLVLTVQAVGVGAGVLAAGVVAWATADSLIRFDDSVRWIGLAAIAASAGWWGWTRVVPALWFRPGLTEVALRVERSDAGRMRSLAGVLAAGYELGRAARSHDRAIRADDDGVSGALRHAVVARAATGARTLRTREVVRLDGLWRGVLVGAMGAALAGGVGIWNPAWARTGAMRVLMPWTDASWPKRTVVVDATGPDEGVQFVHELGVELELEAVVTRTPRPPGQTRVTAVVRGIEGDGAGSVRRVVLSGRGDPDGDGERYAGSVSMPVPVGGLADAVESVYEYWFETEDDRTRASRVRVVPPPEIVGARVLIEPPSYALGGGEGPGADASGAFASGWHDLGGSDADGQLSAGMWGSAMVPGILAGSRAVLEVEFSKPSDVEVWGGDVGSGMGRGVELESVVRAAGDPRAGIAVDRGERSVRASWVAREDLDLEIGLVDGYGIRTGADRRLEVAFEVGEDGHARVVVTSPGVDEAVLGSARMELAARAEDDVGVRWVGLEVRRAHGPGLSAGEDRADDADEGGSWRRVATERSGARSGTLACGVVLDLEQFGVGAGDEVWIRGVAKERYELFGVAREPVYSEVRVLRVIESSELAEQIRGALEAVRTEAMRTDVQQAGVASRVGEDEPSDAMLAAQRAVGDRVGATLERVERLGDRMDRNRLGDQGLDDLVGDVGAALEEAARASARAEGGLEAAEDAGERVREAQREVREELARVVELLDRGQDTWVVRRSLEGLIEGQRELLERTERAGESLIGVEAGAMDAASRSELERIADRQRELAREAAGLVDEMSSRGDRDGGAGEGEAMRSAAERAREAGLSDELERAAEDVSQNRSSSASDRQRSALETMESMLDRLDGNGGARDEVLRRLLAGVVESLDGLIESQRAALDALGDAERGERAQGHSGLDVRMIELHGKTLGLAERVSSGYAELRGVVELIERAAVAQGRAIVSLRGEPVDGQGAARAESRSLEDLIAAREEASRLERASEARQRARAQAELRDRYRELLGEQRALADEAEALAAQGEPLGRRSLRESRILAERQGELGAHVSALGEGVEGLEEASVVMYANGRAIGAMERATERLGRGRGLDEAVGAQLEAARVLESIVEALDTGRGQGSEFADGAGGGGGGGGAGASGQEPGLVPPLAELRLLRAMQAEALERTRAVGSLDDGQAASELHAVGELQRELGRLGREAIERLREQGGRGAGVGEGGVR